ncbi:MAG TPA: response regulator transcription factor [Acidobacteriota bacterium]|nr:response regulator transcription factor [Acidobacteriota bacterium]HMZ78628.1 response regulator transcription factor [Acidobacteriota bacterium]HNB69654.1 response regulator transcription factor [Acidobacteriota bacterium]HNC44674.1 response regulator transcription factor [Acidobacteriota bacterium]HND19701.1 response regulator transcription factor [Acidobacteriota bacterium]
MRRVLIVEDDPSITVALRDGFEYEGYSVLIARDGVEGLRMATEKEIDLVILDVMLPKMSGFDVCKQLRAASNSTPIIMLTARGQEIDKVLGLKMGADDYITKPFSFMELMARVEAVLRRVSRQNTQADFYEFGDITLDLKKYEARKKGEVLDLSPREIKILKYFIDHRGEVVTRDHLLDVVWGYNSAPLTRTVDMHIAKLRQKIEDTPGDPKYIITVHRVGYKFTS